MVVLARHKAAARRLSDQIKRGRVRKEYLALVAGHFPLQQPQPQPQQPQLHHTVQPDTRAC